MPLIEMDNSMFDTQCLQDFGAAYAKHDFLAEPQFKVASIQPGRDSAVPWVILFYIGIKKIEGDAADANLPDCDMDRWFDNRNPDNKGAAGVINHSRDGGSLPVQLKLDAFLPAVCAYPLTDISFRIHETNANQRDIEITAFFEIVTSQKTQTTGIKRQRMMQSKLCRKIGDDRSVVGAVVVQQGTCLDSHILPELRENVVIVSEKLFIPACCQKLFRRHFLEHLVGVVNALFPSTPVQHFKEHSGSRVPAPPEVFGKFAKAGNPLGQCGENSVSHLHENSISIGLVIRCFSFTFVVEHIVAATGIKL